MASELQKKLAARAQKLSEGNCAVFESQQEPSTADCARISPRKYVKDDDKATSGAKGDVPRVASPNRERPRRPSNTKVNFQETMIKRRSLTDSRAPKHESTPNKSKADVESVYESTPNKPKADVESEGAPLNQTPEQGFAEDAQFKMTIEEVEAPVQGDTGLTEESAMVIPTDPACKVYVGNLSWKTRFKSLKAHMATSGGEIAFAGILGDDGSVDGWGWSRGFGFVIYETPEEARTAVQVMNGTELDGRRITVDFWSSEEETPNDKPAKKTWSQEKGSRWNAQYKDDWYWNMFAPWGQQRRGRNLRSQRGDPKVRAWVGNLNYRADWKDLKNHMEPAGDVKWAEVLTRGGWQGAKSKGAGFIEYKTSEQVDEAVTTLNGSEMQGRQIVVDHWTTGARSGSKSR
eukprot:gnl/MRDRNA2_/MRDRNA2_89381_c0_seq1.p1 gnl/MRDRNA2_/MRDRNA2_89381_c0~~gnl/MRDRNA2_/MRDRNA2_89381_c0_seq1.p1  ORF type:complete len:404 (+),score=84.95 gnl/MRDRNA2_/MRDRNA2_89381_c0_seq1:65-1276(+)